MTDVITKDVIPLDCRPATPTVDILNEQVVDFESFMTILSRILISKNFWSDCKHGEPAPQATTTTLTLGPGLLTPAGPQCLSNGLKSDIYRDFYTRLSTVCR